jgi:type IV pilus assembly protein PilW
MPYRCQGLTLVELMISLVLSLVIMAGAISIFMGSKETFNLEEDLSRVQENFRYIADRLTKDLSMVGYTGCALPYWKDSSTVSNRLSGTGNRDVIFGTNGLNGAPDTLTLTYAKPGGGTDVIMGTGADRKSPVHVSTNSALYMALKSNFDKSSSERAPIALMVGNCDGADIFVTTGLEEHDVVNASSPAEGEAGLKHESGVNVGGLSNAEANLNVAYGDQNLSAARIYYVEDVKYEICTDATGSTGLCVTRSGGSKEMLMPDVTDFQVKFGLDSAGSVDGNADHYIDWKDGTKSSNITAVKISLTMVLNQVGGKNVDKTYDFAIKLRNLGLDI